MAKNPNGKPMKREDSLYGAFVFFFVACAAELYLLLIRKYYIYGTLNQTLAWYDYLPVISGIGAAVAVLGVVLSVLWKTDKKKRMIGWGLTGAGVFFAAGSIMIRLYSVTAVTFLSVVVPAVMVLSILWAFYERECSVALTVLGSSLVLLWMCRRLFDHLVFGMPVKVFSVVYILLLGGLAWLAKNHKLGKLLPANADVMPIYVACGLSAAGVAVALFSVAAAYYAMWCLCILVFALAVYYTVRQL